MVTKNIQFTLLVKMEGRVREVNFRKRSESVYDVDMADERGNRYLFGWEKADDIWELKPKSVDAPEWMAREVDAIREAFLNA